jgi:hypothetical protein
MTPDTMITVGVGGLTFIAALMLAGFLWMVAAMTIDFFRTRDWGSLAFIAILALVVVSGGLAIVGAALKERAEHARPEASP